MGQGILNNKRNVMAVISLVSLVFVVLTGCGGGNNITASDSPSASGQSTQSTSASPKEMTSVKLQLGWLPQAEFAGFYVAEAKGYYKAEGLNVEMLPGGTDVIPEQQVANGTAQFGVNLVGSLLSHIEEGVPLVQIGQLFQDSSMILISKKSSGINSPKDFKGKKIGNWMSGTQYEVEALFSKYGFDPLKDLKFVKQGFTMDQFLNGDLDVATAMIYNEYHVVLENGYKPEDLNIFNLDDLGVGMLHDNLFVNKDWLKDNEDTAVKFVRASIKGWKDAVAGQEAATDIVMNAMEKGSSTREHQQTMMQEVAKLVQPKGYPTEKIGFTDQTKFQQTADIALKFGIIKKPADVSTAYTNDIIQKAMEGL